ncbi:MAG: response regulator [Bacteroidetes bacterium]|nr:response regulator [Bacteroidota bacterium]
MSEELKQRVTELEKENKKLRFASQQWELLEKTYRKSNEELGDLQMKLAKLQEQTDHALFGGDLAWWEWDYRSGKVQFNENRARLLGFKPDELPNSYSGITGMIHPDDYNHTMIKLQKHLNGDHPNYEAEFRLQTKSGEWRWFFDKGKIVETDILGKPIRLSGVLIDIHERKSTENLLIIARDKADSDSRSKSNFLASMSHDIYTPMAGVIGMAEILKQSKLSEEQEEYLNVIVKSATNLMSILNDIIEYSKIESGKLEFHEKPFSIHQVVEEVTASFLEKAAEKDIEILSFQDPDIPLEVVGDPVRLRQVIRIISDNALKFTEQGQIRIEAHFLEWDNETVKVKFNITDTGIGISEEGMKKLFTSFSKFESAESQKYGGGGLGLAIAKRLIDRMNGQITVESTPGEGTTLSFTVLFERYKDTEVADPMKEMLRGLRVLVIDPSQTRRAILSGYLDRWEAEVEQCVDPADALKMIGHQSQINRPYNLIVIDYDLPGSDGLQFASSLKNDRTVQKSIILLSVSRRISLSSSELAAAGVVVALVQPYTLSRLRHRIKDALTQANIEEIESYDDVDFHLQEDQKKVLSILLAEDNLINQKVALVILEKIGHAAELAVNGKVAFERYIEKEFDLVLMDIQMPEMDGFEAARRIRAFEAEHPERDPVHICAITANRSSEDEENCYKAGMNSYISKPFRLDELTRILNHL